VIDVRGDAPRIIGNDVSGPGFLDRNAACILLDGVRGGMVDGNTVHACTRATRHDLSAPGILVASTFRTRVANNVVFHTVGDGIALGPNAQRTRVQRNIVDGNVSGIFFGGGERTASSYNVVTRNIVSNSGRFSIHSAWPGPVGRGNVVSSNCLWNGFGGTYDGSGFSPSGNIMTSPRYRNRPRDFTLGNSPCAPMHPTIVAIRLGRLPQFSVAYRLRALPRRVQIVALTLKGLSPRAKVTLRCTARCGTHWVGRPSRSSYTLPVLRGAWLKRGAVIEVREQKDGWIGQAARIVVTGLPRGVRVDHWSG
jgi:Right handed beta helix region